MKVYKIKHEVFPDGYITATKPGWRVYSTLVTDGQTIAYQNTEVQDRGEDHSKELREIQTQHEATLLRLVRVSEQSTLAPIVINVSR